MGVDIIYGGIIGVLSKKQLCKFLLFLSVSFIILTFCSMTSFLFPIHNWVDQNCFFTVGKGIINGLVPYRDLFEQKGPLLYFINAVAALITEKSFIGVFVIQILFYAFFLSILNKISLLFIDEKLSIYSTIFAGILVATTYCYRRGDNAEELCLPLLAYGLYTLLKAYKSDFQGVFSYKTMLINGIFVGCILWIKFSLLGFHLGFIVSFFILSLMQKRYREAFLKVAVFAGGIFLATIPFIIYFAVNGAIKDWLYVYIYSNVFLYSGDYGLIDRLVYILSTIFNNIIYNSVATVMIILGIFSFCLKERYISEYRYRIALLVSVLMLVIGIYIGGVSYKYYFLIVMPFVILGIIFIVSFCNKNKVFSKIFDKRLVPTVFVCCLAIIIFCSNCRYYYFKEKNDFTQYNFAEIIKQTPNATLLNYGFLDGGFYHTTNIQPSERYFCRVNISEKKLAEMYEEQQKAIESKKYDYVVTRKRCKETDDYIIEGNKVLYENYELVDTAYEKHDQYLYALLKKK